MFDPTTASQTMKLGQRRPSVTISKAADATTYPVPGALEGDLTIAIYKGAMSLSGLVMVNVASVLALSVF